MIVQQLSRILHVTNSGIDIRREFYVEPYESHPEVIKTLLGWVDDDGTRHRPARDTHIRNCYCNEAVVHFADQDAMASSPGLDVKVEPPNDTLIKKLENVREAPIEGSAGATITAHYRPLITAWKSADPEQPDIKEFDYLDPKYTPGIRQVPWPPGLFVKWPLLPGNNTWEVPDSVATPIGVPITDVSIRRILVKTPPWDAIKKCAFATNKGVWPVPGSDLSKGGLPRFEERTLKFQSADVSNMIDSEGHRWHEVTLNFKWMHFPDTVCTFQGIYKQDWVTWNHVLMRPAGCQTAWYEVSRALDLNLFGFRLPQMPGAQVSSGYLYNGVDFDELFQ